MAESDLILLVVLAVLVGAAGYLFGTRSRRIAQEEAAAKAKAAAKRAGARADASKADASKGAASKSVTGRTEIARTEPPKRSAANAAEVEADVALVSSASSDAAPASVSPSPSVPSEPSEPPPASGPPAKAATIAPPASPFSSEVALVQLYEEDDEDVEPTRIGKNPILPAPVQRFVYDEDAETDEPTRATPFFVISATAQTDPGLRRKRNEDNLLVLDDSSLYVVADGMGGHRGGKLASEIAVKTIGEAHRTKHFEGEAHDSIPRDASELARAIQMANATILETSKRQPDLEGMGTTVCAVRFSLKKRRFFVGHVGDSRCYRLREGVMTQLTADHTMADFGVAGPESAHLSRAIGIWPVVPIDVILGTPELGDVYLLCSDGLTKMLDDDMIATVLRSEEDPKSAVERLIFFANARGGKDNVTVVLLRVVPPSALSST